MLSLCLPNRRYFGREIIESEDEMPSIELKFKVTLELNEKWAGNQTTEELVDYIKARLNSSLGFRGQIKKVNVVKR